MNTLICSYNVRGLGNKTKREQIFEWVKRNNYTVCLLQETHSGGGTHDAWQKEWGKEAFFSGTSNNSEGVGILINSKESYNILNYTEIICGRLQALEIKINENELIVINIYGPNNDDINIFSKLEKFIQENDEKTILIDGDFNTVLDENLDKHNGRTNTHKQCRNKLKHMIDTHNLIDIWREKYPDSRKYTWHSSHKPPIFSRLDYFLVSENVKNFVVSCDHLLSFKSDHCPVLVTLDLSQHSRGPGYFKLNNSLLLDIEYQEIIKTSIKDITNINADANPNNLWELIKGTVRNETIKYAARKKKENNELENRLSNDINKLKIDLTNSLNNDNSQNIKSNLDKKISELESLIENKINGSILRSKAIVVEYSERNSKYFANLEKKKSETKLINRLLVNNEILTDQTKILKATEEFYKNLYEKKETKDSAFDFFDNTINKLSETEADSCDGLLTELECKTALKYMKNQKSPGSDGLTVEFYKIFWNDIKHFYIRSINYSYKNGSLTELQKQGVITLLPKPNKDIEKLENWRPISLLNVDYKIATKAIANRIKPIITSIVDNSQTGFIKGRFIGENIRLLFDIIETAEEQNNPGLLFFSDFEKAFDSLDHAYMFKCLKHLNFGNSFTKWIKLFYTDVKSCVANNGYMSNFFSIHRGVRQGCPLSTYLFIICIELLSYKISTNEDLKGIHFFGKEFRRSLFADDASFILDGSYKSFETLIYILDNFANISGLKLNAKKCQVLRIGALRKTEVVYLKHRKFQWNSSQATALGMTFTTNKDSIFEVNLEPKINNFENCLKQWQHRKLTLMGKITVIKSFALPKLIYVLSSLQSPPADTIKRIETIMYKFIWDGKPDKIKREILIQDYGKGGLKMIDIKTFIKALKISWIKRIIQTLKQACLAKSICPNSKNMAGNCSLSVTFPKVTQKISI